MEHGPNDTLRDDSQSQSPLFLLPAELRHVIYTHLLTSCSPDGRRSFGRGSEISTGILGTCDRMRVEGAAVLYGASTHTFAVGSVAPGATTVVRSTTTTTTIVEEPSTFFTAVIPARSFARLRKVKLHFYFAPLVRGDCEVGVPGAARLEEFSVAAAQVLRSPDSALEELRLTLCDVSQRGRGPKRLRRAEVVEAVRGFVRPYLYLPPTVRVLELGGFDAGEYGDWFGAERRRVLRGVGRDGAEEEEVGAWGKSDT